MGIWECNSIESRDNRLQYKCACLEVTGLDSYSENFFEHFVILKFAQQKMDQVCQGRQEYYLLEFWNDEIVSHLLWQ